MRSLAIGLILAVGVSAQAGVLWGKTESGQSLEAVQQLYPEGVAHEPSEKLRSQTGSMFRFELKNVPVGSDKYAARFYFRDDRLEHVKLSLQSDHSGISCNMAFTSVKNALGGKYGAPVGDGANAVRGVAVLKEVTFASGDLVIELFGASSSGLCIVSINYIEKTTSSGANL